MLNKLAFAFTVVSAFLACGVSRVEAQTTVDVETYVPYAAASGGYQSFLRVINSGGTATPITVARIDPNTGVVASSGQLTASLPAGAAVTFSAQQVEAALGTSLAASDRPRIRVMATAATDIRVQSFLLQPGGVFNVQTATQSGSTITVPTYLPAASAPSGYESYLRVINTGGSSTPVSVAFIDQGTGVTGSPVTLTGSLPAGAAITYTANQIETALGISPSGSARPQIVVTGNNSTLDAQSFLTQPGGAFTNVSSLQSGTTVNVRTYIPAATASYTSYIRIVNNGSTASPVTATVLSDSTGTAGASGTIVASLSPNAAVTLSSSQIESTLGVNLAANSRPRLQISAGNNNITVQSFMLQPGGAFNEFSAAQTGTSINVRTYIPAADAATGYTSYLRVINTGSTSTPVTVAVIDGVTGATGTTATLVNSLPAGAAQSFTPSQVEAALGTSITAGTRPRILVSSNGSNVLEVQSFLIQPGSAFTEVSGGQGAAVSTQTTASIAGTWTGTFTQPGGPVGNVFSYQVQLTQNGGTISGTSYSVTGNYSATMTLQGSVTGNQFAFQETAITSQVPPPGSHWCQKAGTLTLTDTNGQLTLAGNWTSTTPGCLPGSVNLTTPISN